MRPTHRPVKGLPRRIMKEPPGPCEPGGSRCLRSCDPQRASFLEARCYFTRTLKDTVEVVVAPQTAFTLTV